MRVFKKIIRPTVIVCLVLLSCFWPCPSPADESDPRTGSTAHTDVAAAPGKEGELRAGSAGQKVEAEDLVTIDYAVFTAEGKLVYSTRAEEARGSKIPRAAGYREPPSLTPEEVTAGKAARIPGVGESLVGMALGEQMSVMLPPDRAFGPTNPKLIKTFPTVKTVDKVFRISPEDYAGQFHAFPSEGREIRISPYLKARVRHIADTYAEVEVTNNDTEHFDEEFGPVEARREGDRFKVTLSPKIGASFRTATEEGRIIAADSASFTVDSNNPLAGKSLVAEIRVLKVIRASELAGVQIPWTEEHDKGLAAAEAAGKPAVLVLYADWCQWCKKLLAESFPDPRIRELKDRLTWIKVNSDRFKDYGKKYGQKSFPTIVFFKPDGTIARKVEGYLDAAALREALEALIDGRERKAS